MYRAQRRVTNRKKSTPIFLVLSVLVIFGIVYFFIQRDVTNSTKIKANDQAINGYYNGGTSSGHLTVDEPTFGLTLPDDWKEIAREGKPNPTSIQWRSTKKGGESRDLKIYIDKIPETLAVNKVLPITIVGNKITVGDVSDNCINFNTVKYNPKSTTKVVEQAPGVWQNANFICDLGNYVRNVVGTAVVGGNYKATFKTKAGKDVSFLFVYTDHTTTPDYQILTDTLTSFEVH
jgi:hypothetical protein